MCSPPRGTRSAPCGTCLLRPARRPLCSHSNITHFLAAAECTEGFSGRPEGSQLRRARPASTPHAPWSSWRLSACTDRPFGSPASSSPQSSLCCALSHWGPRCGRHLELLHTTVCPPTSPSVSHTRLPPALPLTPASPALALPEPPSPSGCPLVPRPGRTSAASVRTSLSPLWSSFLRRSCPAILSVSFRPGTASLPREPATSAGRQGVTRTWRVPLASPPTTRRHRGLAAASRTRREPSLQQLSRNNSGSSTLPNTTVSSCHLLLRR